MSLEHAKRIAEAIIQVQQQRIVTESIVKTGQLQFKESPRPLSYYYQPHKYALISTKDSVMLYNFTVPPNHLFHIQRVANNWYEDTHSNWEIDGARIEKVERVISFINSPLDLSGRYITAYKTVTWTTYNNSVDSIEAHVVIDGTVYLIDDWKKLMGQI